MVAVLDGIVTVRLQIVRMMLCAGVMMMLILRWIVLLAVSEWHSLSWHPMRDPGDKREVAFSERIAWVVDTRPNTETCGLRHSIRNSQGHCMPHDVRGSRHPPLPTRGIDHVPKRTRGCDNSKRKVLPKVITTQKNKKEAVGLDEVRR
jgi:hypothetical protein